MFKIQLTENKMIAITFILVLIMAFPTYQTLAQNDASVDEGTAALTSAEKTAPREPASIPSQVLKNVKSVSQFQTINLKCSTQSLPSTKVAGGFVQFQGKNCIPKFKDGDVEIFNKRNGFTASIFQRGSDQYQTDLIQLEHGDNEIVIRYREGSGKFLEQVVSVSSSAI